MKFSQLRAIVAVADRGNFSEAALELQLSQPAISHAIATLEEELGVPLFARGRHGAVLTPAGERILYHARQAMQHLEMMQHEANLHKGLHGGHVRIAAFRSVATHLLPKAISQFHNQFPEIAVTIIECPAFTDVEQCLRDGRTDIGITCLPTGEEFDTWEIFQDEYLALLPPHTKISSPEITWEDIAAYPPVLLPCTPCGRILHNHLKTLAIPINTASDIQEDSTVVSMVNQGLRAAIMPRLAAVPIPPKVQVYSLPAPLKRVIGTAILSNALHVPAVFTFLEMLKKFDFYSLAKSTY
ncbi:LysR family transcriptional regulator [Nostoc sp. FACHB-888]|jgi:DNA-binding transcriptional LysR family regulator|uniref:LysR family transcriptional regulator n=1 Tax=Nostoc sp. FACHB-888 TaxID=2692842 RepID=UPI0016848FE0|nr:LysR family transcriptional regulator [Nostoc sp. FACHB-888]MBD2242480.1 LysR family transcriptional regulator [Nostoc sp. FACHB-888]MBW4454900.1 LysR family transcriptional regulator [Nostoc indistinguendum CM1-VF10]MCC5654285.1 LysR family transcriptional regulator [Nostoc sp. XA013]